MATDRTFINLVFEDSLGRRKRKRIEMVQTDLSLVEADANVIVAAFEAATKGIVREYSVVGEYFVPGPASASNVDTGVTMSAQLSGRPEKAAFKWPMPEDAYILPGGIVDTSNVLVTDIQALFQAGTGICLLSDGESIEGFYSGTLDK